MELQGEVLRLENILDNNTVPYKKNEMITTK